MIWYSETITLAGVESPMLLTREQQEKARAYLYTQARPVEAALYAYLFEGVSNDPVVAALVPYQNPDGASATG